MGSSPALFDQVPAPRPCLQGCSPGLPNPRATPHSCQARLGGPHDSTKFSQQFCKAGVVSPLPRRGKGLREAVRHETRLGPTATSLDPRPRHFFCSELVFSQCDQLSRPQGHSALAGPWLTASLALWLSIPSELQPTSWRRGLCPQLVCASSKGPTSH